MKGRKRLILLLSAVIAILCLSASAVFAEQGGSSTVRNLIEDALARSNSPDITVEGEYIYSQIMVRRFYQKRGYLPAWSGKNIPLAQADDLLISIRESYDEGLTPEYYHLKSMETILNEIRTVPSGTADPRRLAALDLFLTDAFLLLGCHLSSGCLNPVMIETQWFADSARVDVDNVLEKALRDNTIRESLRNLAPPDKGYRNLKQALIEYRTIAAKGGWGNVPDGRILKTGMRSNRVSDLRKRLASSGDLSSDDETSLFNDAVENAVRRFQHRHGLKADGIVGPETVQALNVPAEKRVRQLEINLERLRWSFRNLGERYILVNIADYHLFVVEHGRSLFSMRVIVGKPFWNTPVFRAEMKSIVLNPSWNVPTSIALEEIIPKILKDPEYLAEQSIAVLKGWGEKEQVIGPETVEWSLLSEEYFPCHLRQDPGPLNPLGRIKFLLPNQFGVYLHDSPNKGLFGQNVRTFSHGCIRLEKPFDLATYLLSGDPRWTDEAIKEAIVRGKEETIHLPRPIPVYILYLTAWADDQGMINFRKDIYGRDEQLDEALLKKPPSPALGETDLSHFK
jgi:murein L,D-transpeptidase YcbB/YkuD